MVFDAGGSVPDEDADDGKKSDDNNMGVIIGATLGAVSGCAILMVCCVLIAYIVFRVRRPKRVTLDGRVRSDSGEF